MLKAVIALGLVATAAADCPGTLLLQASCIKTAIADGNAPPPCEAGVFSKKDESFECCQTCIPPKVRTCPVPSATCTEKVTFDDNNCPSCVRKCAEPTTTCTAATGRTFDKLNCPTCKKPTMAECTAPTADCSDALPFKRDALGCVNCKRTFSVCTAPTADCTKETGVTRSAAGCLTCKIPARKCTKPTVACTKEDGLTRDSSSGCPTCFPPNSLDCKIPKTECAAATTFDAKKCPTCRPKKCVFAGTTKPDCTKVPVCKEGIQPERGDDCCPTCKQEDRTEHCKEKKDECKEFLMADDTPVCDPSTDKTTIFSRDTCCLTCKRPEAAAALRPDAAGRCDFKKFKDCQADQPVCGDDQRPIFTEGHCCASCKRHGRMCEPEAVAACRVTREKCKDGEVPQHMTGECCPTCQPGRPACPSDCADNEVCVDRKNPKCVKRVAVKLGLKLKDAARRAEFRKLDEEGIREVITEIIERFCENPDNTDKCEKHKERLVEGIKVRIEKRGTKADDEDVIVIDTPEDDAIIVSRRLFSESSQLLEGAMAEEGEDSGISSSEKEDTSGAAKASAGILGLAAAAVAFAFNLL